MSCPRRRCRQISRSLLPSSRPCWPPPTRKPTRARTTRLRRDSIGRSYRDCPSANRGFRPPRGKSDPGDALAIARVTAREPDLPPIRTADQSSDIAQLVEAREDVVAEATRVRNRLHADLRVLVPGYGEQAAHPVAACHQRTVARRLCGLGGVQAELAR